MKTNDFRLVIVCLAALSILRNPAINAQVLYGSIIGNVKDSSDAVIAGAKVTIINTDTNQSREALTNEMGSYDFPTISPGSYKVRVTKPGFMLSDQTGIMATANNTTRVDVTLKIGAVTESVLVTGAATALQTDRSEVRAEVAGAQLENLPVPVGRNYQNLFVSLPGFSPPQANYHSVPSNPAGALVFNVNGTDFSSNATKIDGADSLNIMMPHEVAYVPSLDSIDTVNVVTNSFDAETGLAGGAAIYVQSKGGTNNLHGSAFENHTDQHLKAK